MPRLTQAQKQEILEAAPYCMEQGQIADRLGIPKNTLYSRVVKLGISDEVKALLGTATLSAGLSERLESVVPKVAAVQESVQPPTPEIVGAGPDVEVDIERIRASAEARFAAKAKRAERKKHQKVYFPHGPVALFVVSDQHIGSDGCNVARMFAEQQMIMDTPGAYVIQAGDIVDNFIVGKLIAQNFNETLAIWEQWQLGKAYLAGFGDRLIAVNSGNHPQWTTKLMGVDYDREITPDGVLYDADEVNFDVHVGNKQVKVRMRHRWRGRSQYSVSHALEKAARFEDSSPDIFIGGHVHEGASAREFVLGGKRKLALMASTYKEHDGYQREQGFIENDASTAVACVINDSGTFWGTSDLRAVMEYQKAVYHQ